MDIHNQKHLSKIRLVTPHQFSLNCYELQHECEHNAKGLIILKNECTQNSKHHCEYYTCRHWATQCKENANGRYIKTLTCEHHNDHKTGLRHLVDMKCEYKHSCYSLQKQCIDNSLVHGWEIKSNNCKEIHIENNRTIMKTELKVIHECEYYEPQEFLIGNDMYQHLQYFQPLVWVENYIGDDSFHSVSQFTNVDGQTSTNANNHYKNKNDYKNRFKQMHLIRKQYMKRYKNLNNDVFYG